MSKGQPGELTAEGVSLALGNLCHWAIVTNLVTISNLEMVPKALFLLSQGNKEKSRFVEQGDRSHRARLNAAGESLVLAAQLYSGQSWKGLGTKQAGRTKTFFFFILVLFAVC